MTETDVVARTMGELLSAPPLEPADDFFIRGGDSLRAVELIARLSAAFPAPDGTPDENLGAALLLVLFEDATPQALGDAVTRHRAALAAG
ncbi:phosphopantetheine-binding protein [Dactylosporangium sp. AC04546]|uniref:phosphopantetheine-binding protein n=1 Tax=Dactylosporangium sp. AC04546 TaxID=2862460 RepID=UPI001EE0FBFF|nr:phosphopantetheine-binding protein [Dactylosporangium sp. AC04546]WVK81317.1 phosphopantetheine-binding protein [Dactylosporangium sp. AC04546]